MAADKNWMQDYQGHGFNMLACGTDHGLLMAGAAAVMDSVRDREPGGTKAKGSKKSKGRK